MIYGSRPAPEASSGKKEGKNHGHFFDFILQKLLKWFLCDGEGKAAAQKSGMRSHGRERSRIGSWT
jgi:hypothetical protein